MEETPTYLEAKDMIKLIDNNIGQEITELLTKTNSPLHAMATLSAVIASFVTSIVNTQERALQNADAINEFAKVLATEVIINNDQNEIKVEDDETLH